MNFFEFFKNLFLSKKTYVQPQTVVETATKTETTKTTNNLAKQRSHDVFGDVIESHELLVPVEYVDVRRRGYLTVALPHMEYHLNELPNDVKNVIRLSTLDSYYRLGKVRNGHKRGFVHVHCNMQAFK